MMAGMANVADALPLRMPGAAGMAWCRPAIRPRRQAANDVAPLLISVPGQGARLQADVRRLAQAVDLLPRRHRQVLEALRVDELTRQEVAERHDMSLRNVDTALRQALDHCARHTGYAAQGGVGTTRRSLRLNVRSRTDA